MYYVSYCYVEIYLKVTVRVFNPEMLAEKHPAYYKGGT